MTFSILDIIPFLGGAKAFSEADKANKKKAAGLKAQNKKTITVNGQQIQVPADFDSSIADKQAALNAQLKESLAGQVTAAEEAVAAVPGAEAASLAELRRRSAQALATQRGLIEGGKGLAAARGTAAEAGLKAGLLKSQFADQLAQAKSDAAGARSSKLVEEGKLLQADKEFKAGTERAKAEVNAVIKKYEGDVFTTSGDRDLMIADLEAKMASETNPLAVKVFADAIADLKAGNVDTGAIDIG